MNKKQFLDDSAVKSFIDWLSNNLSKIEITLKIGKSKFVQDPINEKITGIDSVLQYYKWKSSGMQSGNWAETKARLVDLSAKLKNAVSSSSEDDTLNACKNILAWGGNRNWNVGAYPFLQDKTKNDDLCNYIQRTGAALKLSDADTTKLAPTIEKMNAMLTKVHALYAEDGLPIYDSRVAAAIATLVELWRKAEGLSDVLLPSGLSFPATVPTRSVYRAFPDAQFDPGLIGYDTDSSLAWASAKIRLGFILQAVLERNAELFSGENRMHAFEACLFMIGYNVSCLTEHDAGKLTNKKSQKRLSITNDKDNNWKEIVSTLSGNGEKIIYTGTLTDGYECKWGGASYSFNSEMLTEMVDNFSGKENVPLGASQDRNGPEDSLGIWLNDAHGLNPRTGSAIAAILVNDGLISSKGKRPIFLNFSELGTQGD
ncbi:MAG: hypothetical protein ACXW11_03605 [Methylotenera sp.]